MVNIDGRGTRYEYDIPREAADWLSDALSGSEVDNNEAAEALETIAHEMDLPHTRGWQLEYYAQRVLLVLVARGEASLRRQGRRFLHTVSWPRIRSEVPVGRAEGLERASVVNLDKVLTVPKEQLEPEPVGRLGPRASARLDAALCWALDIRT